MIKNLGRGVKPYGADILENRDIWPVLQQHLLAIGLNLAEGNGSHSGSLKAK
jgi:hypothetical protein